MKQPELSKKIQQLRKSRRLTQEELVEKCRINVRTIQRHYLSILIFLRAFPFGSRYPLYLFCLIRTKKDAAFIANATLDGAF